MSKHKEKATGLLIETHIKFGKESLNSNSDNYFGGGMPRARMMMAPPPMMAAAPMMCKSMAMAPMMCDMSAPPMAPMMKMAAPVMEY